MLVVYACCFASDHEMLVVAENCMIWLLVRQIGKMTSDWMIEQGTQGAMKFECSLVRLMLNKLKGWIRMLPKSKSISMIWK